MAHDLKTTIAHGLHVAHNTEIGKKALHTVGAGAVAAATAVLGPTLAPVAVVAAVGWGLWKVLKK
jgi:hypothetical protein